MNTDQAIKDWLSELDAELVSSQGFWMSARQGRFDLEKGQALLRHMDHFQLPDDGIQDRNLERRIMSAIWALPYSLERQTRRILKKGGDVFAYIVLVSQISVRPGTLRVARIG